MNEYENNINSGSGENENTNTNSVANGYTDYRSGYYRNTNPHQDEPINTSSYANTSGYNSSYNNQSNGAYNGNRYTNSTGSENGFSYTNYYNNSPVNNQSPEKPEKKGKAGKIARMVALTTAAVILVGGAFYAGGYFVGNMAGKKDNIQKPSASTDLNGVTADTENSTQNTTTESIPGLIDLASREGAITVPEIVAKMTPSVVGIQATYVITQTTDPYSGFGGFGGFFGNWGGQSQTQTQEAVGTGTGVIMSEDGYIVTNAHVIYDSTSGYGAAKSVEVQMHDGETTYPAEIVAYDVETDLAVLKVNETGLTPAEFGNSDECQVGELVVAIGNPLGLELQNTVTCGIISALNREITINDKEMTLIQTDTAINSGNSGGPLINSAGQVIGINSAKMSSSYSANSASIEGIGFAIPITEAKEIVNDLIQYGYVTGRPQLGISCEDVSEAVSQAYNIPVGSYIISVTEGGAADKAGLRIQDVIIAIDGNEIKTTEELNDYKNEHDAGEQVVLTIVRSGQQMDVTVVLEEAVTTEEQP